MWVRIREVSFLVEKTDEVIAQVRDTAVARFEGESHRGFRLLIDRPNGRALEVSYWETEEGARAGPSDGTARVASAVPGWTVLRTEHYELAIEGA